MIFEQYPMENRQKDNRFKHFLLSKYQNINNI